MSPKKRRAPPPPSFRTELKRRASALGVADEDLDRALVIGQLAGLMVKDPQIRGKLAHKGAAVLRLVNKSERLSRDLDTAEIRGQKVAVSACPTAHRSSYPSCIRWSELRRKCVRS